MACPQDWPSAAFGSSRWYAYQSSWALPNKSTQSLPIDEIRGPILGTQNIRWRTSWIFANNRLICTVRVFLNNNNSFPKYSQNFFQNHDSFSFSFLYYSYSSAMESTQSVEGNKHKPICCIVVGMAGSGKTTLMQVSSFFIVIAMFSYLLSREWSRLLSTTTRRLIF